MNRRMRFFFFIDPLLHPVPASHENGSDSDSEPIAPVERKKMRADKDGMEFMVLQNTKRDSIRGCGVFLYRAGMCVRGYGFSSIGGLACPLQPSAAAHLHAFEEVLAGVAVISS